VVHDLAGCADEVDGDLDGDLLAPSYGNEVDVLEVPLERVAHDGLGQRELLALVGLEREQLVLVVAQRHHQLVARQREVPGLVAVAVKHDRHLVGGPDPTGMALAELGAGLGDDADLGHGGTLLRRTAGLGRACGRDGQLYPPGA